MSLPALCALVAIPLFAAPALAGETTRVSVDSAGAESDGASFDASLSANGRFIGFTSLATTLVESDTNAAADVFLHDRKTGATTRVSVDSAGAQASGASGRAAVSGNGRFVAFESTAGNLSGIDGSPFDVFLHDTLTGATTLVSVDAGGGAADDDSGEPSVSQDGRLVVFESLATDLVAGDGNGAYDVFLRDTQSGVTTRVSVRTDGGEATGGDSRNAVISPNGRFVVFASEATNLVDDDSNGLKDIFVRDLKLGVTSRVSLDSAGAQVTDSEMRRPSISANGRYVAFASVSAQLVAGDANGLGDIFVRDRKKGLTVRASVAPGGADPLGDDSNSPVLTASGKRVVFESGATNLVADDTNGNFDAFASDWKKGKVKRLSVTSAGQQVGHGEDPAVSKSGKYVAFESIAADVVEGDGNGFEDVFLRRQ